MSEETSIVEQPTADVTQESSPVEEPAQAVEGADEEFDSETAEITEQPVAGTGAEKRIKQLAAQRKAEQEARIKAEREAAYYRGLSEARGGGDQPKPQVVQPKDIVPVAPTSDQFETWEEYEKAKDDYLIQAAEYRFSQRFQEQQRQQAEMVIQQQFDSRLAKASESDPALSSIVMEVGSRITGEMGSIIKQSDAGVDIVRWLHKNPQEMQRIASLPPFLAAKELGYVEANIKNTPKPAPPKRVSAAPEPIQTVGATSPAAIDDEDLPMEEYYRRRTKQMYGR